MEEEGQGNNILYSYCSRLLKDRFQLKIKLKYLLN